MSFLDDNFLIKSETAQKLYFEYAKEMPIFDYHCHLSEYDILEDKEFDNVYDIWLSNDHYKWRLMRDAGVDEKLITGFATKKEKFVAYCKALSTAFGNPLYHWSQFELEKYFHCTLEINEKNADSIWEQCNAYIKKNCLSPSKLIISSNVKYVFTTNEIFDDLKVFDLLGKKYSEFAVIPTFRTDKIVNIDAEEYLSYLGKLGDIKSLGDLEKKIEERLLEFIKHGCRASDIALQNIYKIGDKNTALLAFTKRINGRQLSYEEAIDFKGYLAYFLLCLYAKYNIRSELHIGAMRNNNTEMFIKCGLDAGYDSIAEDDSINNLSKLMDKLNSEHNLPPMIIFNLNPKMNEEIVTLIACFQDSSFRGKIQYGPAWWFLDNKHGIKKQLKDLSLNGHLGSFIGMLTDSRSFLSFQRHHYFRRILCSYLGKMMEDGEMTQDVEFVGNVVRDICYYNAYNYFMK